jgi:hypothetical protein
VNAALKRKPKRCAATKTNGNPCTSSVISAEGAVRLLDKGIALVADPTSYCSWHCRTPQAIREMAVRGGKFSPKAAAVNREPEAREPMPDDVTIATKMLIRELLAATIPNVFPVEPDVRTRALGVYLALQMFEPDDRGSFAPSLLPHRSLDEIDAIAQDELRAMISQLKPEAQSTVWEAIAPELREAASAR